MRTIRISRISMARRYISTPWCVNCVKSDVRISFVGSRCWSPINLLTIVLLQLGPLPAEPIPVRYREGAVHGFLALRTLEGKTLAAGDLSQTVRGNQVESRLIFRFRDGSVDD